MMIEIELVLPALVIMENCIFVMFVRKDIRHQGDMEELYNHRKETIGLLFVSSEEYHN